LTVGITEAGGGQWMFLIDTTDGTESSNTFAPFTGARA